jgi:6-phosphogluconolactonase
MRLPLKKHPFWISLIFCFLNLELIGSSNSLLFIGTNGKGAEGIYRSHFNESNGWATAPTLAAKIDTPNFLTLHPTKPIIYAVAKWRKVAGVVGYQFDENGNLDEFTRLESPDGLGCHITVHPSGQFLLTAQYGGGSVACFSLKQTGELLDVQVYPHAGGSGVVPNRQKSPHPHWCGFSPCGKFALVPDLGLDQIVTYRIKYNPLELIPHSKIDSLPGGGPRHMKFSTDGKYIYLLDELSLVIETFLWEPSQGQATRTSSIPTLTEEEKLCESFNSAAEIRVHPSGKWVYSSNRGHDSVSVFETASNGNLQNIQKQPVRGAFPRNFTLNQKGTWLLAAGQDSNTVSSHRINQETGKLTYQRGSIFNVPNPTCLLFIE